MFILKKLLLIVLIVVIAASAATVALSFYVKLSTRDRLLSESELCELGGFDCILVLGAGVTGEEPSSVLHDRITAAVVLYEKGAAPKLLMSGDHARDNYDEVNVMKSKAVSLGVLSSDVFMDHAGLSTYDSVYRAREIFKAKKIIIVTQKYHLYRALYIAERLGVEAYGAAAEILEREGGAGRELREIAARAKDVVKCVFKPEAKILGEAIPVNGDGDVTNDK
ncbi:MAG: YdcF family protein [Clostridia bacterium]|nr:YdcF family protein [Clostridia bacterium]